MHGLAVLVIMMGVWSNPTSAQSGGDQSDAVLGQMEAALDKEANLSPETKNAFRAMIGMLRRQHDDMAAKAAESTQTSADRAAAFEKAIADYAAADSFIPKKNAVESFFSHIKFFGDFRFRHESSFDLDDQADRHRQRIRFRLGANLALYDELTLGFRLATGDLDDPNSPHNTLGQVFNKFDFSLDRVFITYRPNWADKNLYLTAGKFGHPFYQNPIYGELVWDDDVQPEGGAVGYTWKNGTWLDKIDFVLTVYDLFETAAGDDAFILAGQIATHFKFCDDFGSVLALSYLAFSDLTPERVTTVLTGDNAGNATVDRDANGTPDDFRSQFGIFNPILSFTYSGIENWPITLAGEFIWNTEAKGSEDDIGYAVGLSAGQAKKAGDWKFDYNWATVERDAVFSGVSQDDFLFQTNHRSHLFSVNYQAADNIGLRLWFLVSRRDEVGTTLTSDSDDYQWRLRLDLNIKF